MGQRNIKKRKPSITSLDNWILKYLRKKGRCNRSLMHGSWFVTEGSRRSILCQLLIDKRKANESKRRPKSEHRTVNQGMERWKIFSHLKLKNTQDYHLMSSRGEVFTIQSSRRCSTQMRLCARWGFCQVMTINYVLR